MNAAKTRTVASIFRCPACGKAVEAVQYNKSGTIIGMNCVCCDWTWSRCRALDTARTTRARVELTGQLTPP